MKNLILRDNKTLRFIFLLLPVVLFLAGCQDVKRILWAPDGNHAVILTGGDLYLCDGSGNLSDVVLSNIDNAAWFRDSQRLVLARQETRTNWSTLAVDLPSRTKEGVAKLSDVLLARLESGTPKDKLGEGLDHEKQLLLSASLIYLRDERPTDTQKALGNSTNRFGDVKAKVHYLQLAHLSGDRVELDAVLSSDLGSVDEIRISPNDKFIAYADGREELIAISVDGQETIRRVDKLSGSFDWSPDSRSLAYIKPEGSGSEDVVLSSLACRRVVDDGGHINIAKDAEDLAGMLNDGNNRVRWLRDGRIMFSAMEFHLPATTKEMPQRQLLFAVDPERQATLTRLIPRGVQEQLPEQLGTFELSPDETRLVVGGDENNVVVFTLASGNTTTVQPHRGKDVQLFPSWRGTNEICYADVSEPDNQGKPKVEVALWQAGRSNVVFLSTNWPETIRTNWLGK